MLYQFHLETFPVVSRFYSVVRNTVWQISEREHLLIFINEGACRISCKGETYILKEGDVFFIPKDCPYTRSSVNDSPCNMTFLHFLFQGELLECENIVDLKTSFGAFKTQEEADALGQKRRECKNFLCLESKNTPEEKRAIELKQMVAQLSKYGGVNKSFFMSLSLCEILTLLSNHCIDSLLTRDTDVKQHVIPKKLRRCMDYISRSYTKTITLEELANYCRVSKQHLIRYFKTSLNTTPMQYVTEFKIARAKEMLYYSELTVNEISMELGFDNQHYFAKVFKRTTGETPSEYRERTVNYGSIRQNSKRKEK